MRRWKYPPAVDRLFRRNADGTVEVVYVKGDRPASDAFYCQGVVPTPRRSRRPGGSCGSTARGTSGGSSSTSATARSGSAAGQGGGCSRDGGVGDRQLRHDPRRDPPRPRPGDGLQRASISSRGPSTSWATPSACRTSAPTVALGLGNSLMGPNNDVYAERKLPEGRPGLPDRGVGRDALEAPGLLRARRRTASASRP